MRKTDLSKYVSMCKDNNSGGFRGGARGAVAPPPYLPSQEIQKDGCVVIKTH